MSISYLLKGLIIGFSIAAPVGPIGVLCIKRTLVSGRVIGLASGLGAATADAVYGSIAAFGLTIISNFLIHQQVWLRLVGGAFLCYLGIRTFLSTPQMTSKEAGQTSLIGAYATTLFLTLTNPLTILSFAAVFAGLGLVKVQGSAYSAGLTILGVFLGSASWWLLLTTLIHLIRGRFSLVALAWVNRISGVIILGFGVISILGVVLPK
jgi:threonine/homoserine/homoserine lactone efflux protein